MLGSVLNTYLIKNKSFTLGKIRQNMAFLRNSVLILEYIRPEKTRIPVYLRSVIYFFYFVIHSCECNALYPCKQKINNILCRHLVDWTILDAFLKQFVYSRKSSGLYIIFNVVPNRSIHPEVLKGVPKNFAKSTGKHLCQGLFFNKVAGLRPVT